MSRRVGVALIVVLLLGLSGPGCSGDSGREPTAGAIEVGGTPKSAHPPTAGAIADAILSVEGMT